MGRVRIVGVVRHVKHLGLDADETAKIRDEMYFPFAQIPDQFMPEMTSGANLVMRTKQDPSSVVPAVRGAVAGPTDDQPLYAVRTMEQIISGSLAEQRFTMLLLITLASVALLLAAIGISTASCPTPSAGARRSSAYASRSAPREPTC
ncbi:MAG TPA: hypothetical protein VFY39_00070 [Gammaproteobacteria bacterium]|nr:hypothetical protein [Gammaproteobacteria bacterium]